MTAAQAGPRTEDGATVVEFALAMPLYVLMIFGFLQFSLILFGYLNATYATRVAVRYAIVHGNTNGSPTSATALANIVNQYLWTIPSGSATVNCSWNPDTNAGSTIAVSISVNFPTGIPFSNLGTIPVTVSSQGTIIY